ncbi:MAG: hypothetical protein WCR95_07365 [Eubacteriales bacterium]
MEREKFNKYYVNHIPVNMDALITSQIRLAAKSSNNENMYKSVKNIGRAEAAGDIELFFNILKYCYCGYEYYNELIDFDDLKKEAVSSLPETPTTKAVRDILYKTLSKHINDSHFGFIAGKNKTLSLGKLYRAYFTSLVVELKNGRYLVAKGNKTVKKGYEFTHEQIKDYLFETFPDKQGNKRYLVGVYTQTPVKQIVIGSFSLPAHLCRTDNYKKLNTPVKIEETEGIPIIHHSTYSNGGVKESFESYKKTGVKYKDTKYLIWSILSNGGGNSKFPECFIDGLNNNAVWELDLAVISNPVINESNDNDSENKKSYSIFNIGKVDFSKSLYGGRLFVLQNKFVASSGEAAVMFGRNVKDVCFVGGATMGCGQFGDILTYRLPNTNIYFHMGYKVFNMEGFEEGKGFLPDYWIDSNNPVEEVAAFIKDDFE